MLWLEDRKFKMWCDSNGGGHKRNIYTVVADVFVLRAC